MLKVLGSCWVALAFREIRNCEFDFDCEGSKRHQSKEPHPGLGKLIEQEQQSDGVTHHEKER